MPQLFTFYPKRLLQHSCCIYECAAIRRRCVCAQDRPQSHCCISSIQHILAQNLGVYLNGPVLTSRIKTNFTTTFLKRFCIVQYFVLYAYIFYCLALKFQSVVEGPSSRGDHDRASRPNASRCAAAAGRSASEPGGCRFPQATSSILLLRPPPLASAGAVSQQSALGVELSLLQLCTCALTTVPRGGSPV